MGDLGWGAGVELDSLGALGLAMGIFWVPETTALSTTFRVNSPPYPQSPHPLSDFGLRAWRPEP